MPRAERSRIRKNDPAGLRARVLDAAAAAFQESGYRGTSMQDLVLAAGVTGGALHHHFPTKRDLALAVIAERVSNEVAETWIGTVEAAPNAVDGVVQVFEQVAEALDRRGAVSGCPLGNLALELSLSDEGLRRAIEVEYRAWHSALARCLRRDAQADLINVTGDEAEALAETIVAMFTGAMSIAKAEQTPRALRSCVHAIRRLLPLRGQ